MRVLVTGAGGFVGSAIVRSLVENGAQLHGGRRVDNVVAWLRPGGSATRLETLRADGTWSRVEADIHDWAAVDRLLAEVRPNAVVHAALDDAVYVDDDVTLDPLPALLEALGRMPGPRFVHVGSAWVLAPGIGLDESAPLDPASPYARYKARQDARLPELAERFDVPWINLRLFNVFGRFEKPTRLLPYLVSRLSAGGHADVSHGDQIRDFSDVDDAADAFRLALAAPDAACGATYHIGSGRPASVREFVGHVTAVVGGEDRVRFGAGRTRDDELPALVADPSRAERVLGWNPAPSLEERVRRAAEWWLARLDAGSRQPEGSIR